MKKTIIISIAVIAASGILAFSGYASADNTKEVAANTTSTVELIDRTADQKAMEPQKDEPVAKDVHETYNYSYNDYGRCYDSKPAKKTDSSTTNNYEYKTEYSYTDNSNYVYSSEYSEYNDYDNNYEDYHYDEENTVADVSSDYEGADESYDYEGADEEGADEEGADESSDYESEDYDYDENADYDTDYDTDEIEENTWECVEDVDEAVYDMCCSEDNIFTCAN